MNVFYLDRNPLQCARAHCDKHVVKMIIEYAQLLSTAHRVLDGTQFKARHPETWRAKTFYLFPDEALEYTGERWQIANPRIYSATHVNHPCSVWTRSSQGNYEFLYDLFVWLCYEYTSRYGKVHATSRMVAQLGRVPTNVPEGPRTEPPLAMPDEYKAHDAVTSYQNLYVDSKARFARWTNRRPPDWFIQRIENYDKAHFERTNTLVI